VRRWVESNRGLICAQGLTAGKWGVMEWRDSLVQEEEKRKIGEKKGFFENQREGPWMRDPRIRC